MLFCKSLDLWLLSTLVLSPVLKHSLAVDFGLLSTVSEHGALLRERGALLLERGALLLERGTAPR